MGVNASTWLIALAIAAASLLWWWQVIRREVGWRARVARRYGVTIGTGARGHWRVTSTTRSRVACLAIELLQLAYFIAAFLLWAAGLLAGLLLLGFVQGPS